MQRRIGHARWGIAGLLGTGILINYLSLAQINGHMSAKQELAQGMN